MLQIWPHPWAIHFQQAHCHQHRHKSGRRAAPMTPVHQPVGGTTPTACTTPRDCRRGAAVLPWSTITPYTLHAMQACPAMTTNTPQNHTLLRMQASNPAGLSCAQAWPAATWGPASRALQQGLSYQPQHNTIHSTVATATNTVRQTAASTSCCGVPVNNCHSLPEQHPLQGAACCAGSQQVGAACGEALYFCSTSTLQWQATRAHKTNRAAMPENDTGWCVTTSSQINPTPDTTAPAARSSAQHSQHRS